MRRSSDGDATVATNDVVLLWLDEAATQPATATVDGEPVTRVRTDRHGRLPVFEGPDGAEMLWGSLEAYPSNGVFDIAPRAGGAAPAFQPLSVFWERNIHLHTSAMPVWDDPEPESTDGVVVAIDAFSMRIAFPEDGAAYAVTVGASMSHVDTGHGVVVRVDPDGQTRHADSVFVADADSPEWTVGSAGMNEALLAQVSLVTRRPGLFFYVYALGADDIAASVRIGIERVAA